MTSDLGHSKWTKTPFVILFAVLIYVAWHAPSIQLVLTQGQLRGPDDFLRLHQVLNLLSGQSWFDTTAYRMAPPLGADIHWSRLIDLPIAMLVLVFDSFLPQETAWRIAVIVWPLIVYATTFYVLVKLCETLVGDCHPVLVLLFYALSVVTIAETAPGRIDHHNVQVLLLTTAMLGLVLKPSWKSDLLIGITIPASLSIGMDSAALFLPLIIFIGLTAVLAPNIYRARLVRIGAVFSIVAIVIYAATFAIENWPDQRCDAYSLFYVSALVKLGLALIAFWLSLKWIAILRRSAAARLVLGATFGGIALAALLAVFPHCAAGPFGNFTPALQAEWLSRVVEAKGIFEAARIEPSRWFSDFGFALVTLVICLAMAFVYGRGKPELLALLAVVAICTLGIFFQIRFLRTGIFAAVPFNVLLALTAWRWLKTLPFSLEPARFAALGLICLPMTSLMWFTVGSVVAGTVSTQSEVSRHSEHSDVDADMEQTLSCNAEGAYETLRGLPRGIVMSDINSATPILVHTEHTVVSGPYHRNADAILDVMRFFETDEARAAQIAQRLNIDYVALCTDDTAGINSANEASMAALLRKNEPPVWLELLSAEDSTVLVFKRLR